MSCAIAACSSAADSQRLSPLPPPSFPAHTTAMFRGRHNGLEEYGGAHPHLKHGFPSKQKHLDLGHPYK